MSKINYLEIYSFLIFSKPFLSLEKLVKKRDESLLVYQGNSNAHFLKKMGF